MSTLSTKKCVPCQGGVPPLPPDVIEVLLRELDGWRAENDHHLTKEYKFPDFARALAFVDRIGAVAEEEGHHPDLFLSWGLVRVQIWTHKIDGLTESDFILAAKIDALIPSADG